MGINKEAVAGMIGRIGCGALAFAMFMLSCAIILKLI